MTQFNVGDVVWCVGKLICDVGGNVPYQVDFSGGGKAWLRPLEIRPDSPAPAEMDDVAVLRRAAELMGYSQAIGLPLMRAADRIEAARRAPTLLDIAKKHDAALSQVWTGGPTELSATGPWRELRDAWEAARRAIAAEEAKGDV